MAPPMPFVVLSHTSSTSRRLNLSITLSSGCEFLGFKELDAYLTERPFFGPLQHPFPLSERKASMSSCEPNSSTSERPRNLPDLARRAIDSFHQTSGPNLETPSIQSIMSAYQEEGQGDRELLLAILDAKRTEDEVRKRFFNHASITLHFILFFLFLFEPYRTQLIR